MSEKTGGYSIKAVARLTGLPAHTLRLWEDRYAAIEVARSPGGHRIYSPANLERLARLKRLVDLGLRISELADLPDAELDVRLGRALEPAPAPRPLQRVAIYGADLPAALEAAGLTAGAQLRDTNWQRFEAACVAGQPDGVLIECQELTPERVAHILALCQRCPGARFAATYFFGRSQDVAALNDAGVQTLQAPAAAADLLRLLELAPRTAAAETATAPTRHPGASADPPAPRHFSPGELSRLSAHASAVACECPAHLVQLVQGLNAFEAYSANCEHTSPDDAALHALLYRETSRARAIMEAALARVVEAEAIDY